MYNWSTDTTRLEKNPEKYQKFVLEQRINYGLTNQKLSAVALRKHWKELSIDPNKKAYLKRILWLQS